MSAYIPIEMYSAGLLPNPPRLAAVLFAYIDESGLHATAKSMVVAGLVAPLKLWVPLQGHWNNRMAPTGISTFHAQPCRGGHKEFKPIKELDRKKLYADLAEIASDYHLQPVSGSVTVDAWNNAKKDAVFSERYPTHYSLCFDLCLSAIHDIAEDTKDRVIVIYAIHEAFVNRAEFVGNIYKISERYFKWIEACIPNTPQKVVPLQVADMLTYEVYHQLQDAIVKPDFDLLARLENQLLGFHYGLPELEALIKKGPEGWVS